MQIALQAERKQNLSIATFGASKGKQRTCEVVRVNIALKDGSSLQVSLLIVPLICEPLVSQPISSCIDAQRHLAQLDLADFSAGDTAMEINIHIGSDYYYWELATGEVFRGNSGPIAIYTRLGWVLSGSTKSFESTETATNLIFQEQTAKRVTTEGWMKNYNLSGNLNLWASRSREKMISVTWSISVMDNMRFFFHGKNFISHYLITTSSA